VDYLYHFENASLALRVVEYLRDARDLRINFVTVIHEVSGWVIRLQVQLPCMSQRALNIRAILGEFGEAFLPSRRLRQALWCLEAGESPINVMCWYRVAVVSHGSPDLREIEEFRTQFISGLGYCPASLA